MHTSFKVLKLEYDLERQLQDCSGELYSKEAMETPSSFPLLHLLIPRVWECPCTLPVSEYTDEL
jgi:hypothetical protein